MPRKAELDRPTRLDLRLPESIRTRIDLLLFSEVENRVPQGRYQEFFLSRIKEFFDSKRFSFSFSGVEYEVSGSKEAIEALTRRLNGST